MQGGKMKRLLAICTVVVLVMGASTLFAQQPDKEKLTLKAQMLYERVLRLRSEIGVKMQEHNKAVEELKGIIKVLEVMEKEKQS